LTISLFISTGVILCPSYNSVMLSESIFGSLPCSNIIESTRLVNITMPCSALIYNALSAWFNNINYNSILILISKICFWFSIGIKLYLYILAGGHEVN